LSGTGDRDTARGFALILVVWLLVLIGSISIYLVANGRAETAIAYNVRASAGAEALADAGIARIVLNQLDPKPSARWKLDRTVHRFGLPGGSIEIRLEDETQKINVNLATPALLSALFEVRGLDRAAARRLGAAVADWVSSKQPQGDDAASADPYRAAGKNYGPPHAPAESLDELQLVLGMTPAIFASVHPYLTIHTSDAAPDGKAAPLVIQRAVALAAQAEQDAGDEDTEPAQAPAPASSAPASAPSAAQMPAAQAPAPQAPPSGAAQAATAGEERVIAAEVIGQSREGGLFKRVAVLRLEPDSAKGYVVLDWQRGVIDDADGKFKD
jgi:general secretion pathway protein K